MKQILWITLLLPVFSFSQNVGIGTTTPSEKLEVKNALRTGLKISSQHYIDTTELIFSNRIGTTGTDFSVKSIQEQGLFFSSASDLPQNNVSNALVIVPTGMVGIRTATPVYPLHVNGDINTTGALRVSGDAGSSGQVLESNGDGTMGWRNICEYKNTVTFLSTAGSPWVVPAGVTKIMIEGWGGGGGGTAYGGGGGGGYISAWLNVTPGDNFTIQVGTGGGGGTATATSGGNTFIIAPVGLFSALGGQGSSYSAPVVGGGAGGGFDVPTGFQSFLGERGKGGTAQQFEFHQAGATVFYETIQSGRGGDAGNIQNNGGEGAVVVYNTSTSTITRYSLGASPRAPGGGGAPGYSIITGGGSLGGTTASSGMVMIHY